MIKYLRVLAIVMVCAAVGGGLWTPTVAAQGQGRAQGFEVVTQSDNGESVRLRRGERLKVRLYFRRSTGYEWRLAYADGNVIRLVDTDVINDNPTGESGVRTQQFTFQAIDRGETRLEFRYQRNRSGRWMDTAQTWRITVQVGRGGSGGGGIGPRPEPNDVNLVTQDDSGKTVRLDEGEVLKVRLYFRRSTGAEWRLTFANGNFLQLVDSAVIDGNPTGEPGVQTQAFSFRGVGRGDTPLEFRYQRYVNGRWQDTDLGPWRIMVQVGRGSGGVVPPNPGPGPGPGSDVTLVTQNDNGRSVRLDRGDTLKVRLYFRRSSGFEWRLVNADGNVLQLLDSDVVNDNPTGEPGVQTQAFSFRAVSRGDTPLEFRYQRYVNGRWTDSQHTWRITVRVDR